MVPLLGKEEWDYFLMKKNGCKRGELSLFYVIFAKPSVIHQEKCFDVSKALDIVIGLSCHLDGSVGPT